MLFSSITFLYYFLPVVLILYFIAPRHLKNTVLLLVSLIFYVWGEPKYVFLMIASILIGYISGLLIEAFHNKKWAGYVLGLSIAIHIGMLILFKYTGIFKLPVGISFYTFQMLSYMIDVYQNRVKAQKNFVNLAVYIAMFPQLVAGPIVRYKDIEEQLMHREHNLENFALGMRRLILGLGKKVLLANTLGELCEKFRNSEDKAVLLFWLYAIAFTLRIYFDFSGYSDMAIGLGRIFGFRFVENFNYPYISKSITEFWRRWHMSLGQWFRDYVYIPLGGSRVSKKRWMFNILAVWILTGIWHGGSWNFILWGLYFALFLMMEKQGLLKYLEKSKYISHGYVVLVVGIGFVIFNGSNLRESISYIGGMFGWGKYPFLSKEFLYYMKSYRIVLLTAVLGTTPIVKNLTKKLPTLLEPVVLAVLLLLVTGYLVDGSFHPFLYFRF